MHKKNLAIVLGSTSNLTFAVANVMIGLKNHSPDFADKIIIYHDNISEKDQILISSILPCEYIKYEFPIKDISCFNETYFKQFSELAYSRYECFNLLNEYKYVLWLDVDILIQKNISAIINFGTNGFGILDALNDKVTIKDQLFKSLDGFDMDKKAYSSGTFILQDNLPNYNKMTDWCYKKTLEYADYLYLPDQAILNLLIQEFNIIPAVIDLKRFCCHPSEKNCKNAIILHSYRPEKFWNFWSVKEWNQNYKKWIKLGGTPTKKKTANIISRMVNAKWSDSPDPFRKPRQFIKFLYNKLLKNR
jgi:lipopolysaccharide biosynthesis glycosyltransferase